MPKKKHTKSQAGIALLLELVAIALVISVISLVFVKVQDAKDSSAATRLCASAETAANSPSGIGGNPSPTPPPSSGGGGIIVHNGGNNGGGNNGGGHNGGGGNCHNGGGGNNHNNNHNPAPSPQPNNNSTQPHSSTHTTTTVGPTGPSTSSGFSGCNETDNGSTKTSSTGQAVFGAGNTHC